MGTVLPLALIAYIGGIVLSTPGVGDRHSGTRRAGAALLVLAWALHLVALVRMGVERGHVPLANAGEYLLSLAWLVQTLFLVVWWVWRVEAVSWVLPPAAALLALAAILAGDRGAAGETGSAWFLVHTVLATCGTALLGVACAMSVIYLLLDHALKAKWTLGWLERLPTLETCDRIGAFALMVGFPLLTLGILAGMIFGVRRGDGPFGQGAKEVLSYLAWGVFALLVWARTARGFRGRRAAWVAIAGFALALMVVLGMPR